MGNIRARAGAVRTLLVAVVMVAFAANSVLNRMAVGQGLIDPAGFAVVRLAAQQGMAAPLNARMCELLSGPRLRLGGAEMRRMLGV